MTRTDMAFQGRQMAVLFSMRCTGLVHLESAVGRFMCANSLLRWMEGPLEGTFSAGIGWGEITSFPRSRRIFFFFIHHLHLTRKLRFLFSGLPLLGLRTEKVWQFEASLLYSLDVKRSYPMMAKMLKRLKKDFPNLPNNPFSGAGRRMMGY